MADDASIAEKSLHVGVIEGCDLGDFEACERGTKVLALAQNCQP